MNSAVGAGAPAKQGTAVVALAGVDAATLAVLQDCFRQFGIASVALGAQETARLQQESFAACVVPLDNRASQLLAAIRQSPANMHSVVYGVCDSLGEAMRYSSHGINALFLHPVDRQSALSVVRSTHLMVLRELRRYVRLPLVSAAVLQTGADTVPASTVEISAGGAALHTRARLCVPQSVQMTVQLPRTGELSLGAVVCWIRREEELAGLRFEPGDQHRAQLRQWIDDYLCDN